jgi:hypothetical protein
LNARKEMKTTHGMPTCARKEAIVLMQRLWVVGRLLEEAHIFFKMRIKAKTYGINFLVASHFSHKRLATKKFIPYVLAFILILKSI